MKYPKYREELLKLLDEDQREVRAHSKLYQANPDSPLVRESRDRLNKNVLERAHLMLEILDFIQAPTIENIGSDGSQAVSILALHSRLSIMKQTLKAFEASYKTEPSSVYHEAIPTLSDRIAILEHRKQLFGSQWMVDKTGKFFLYPVEDFPNLNRLRAIHGLGPARHPRDLTYGIPVGPLPPKVEKRDQRTPTEEEYNEYARTYLG